MANPEMHTAVLELLHRIPDRWTDFDRDQLTTTEAQALPYLMAAELVEQRTRLRLRMLSTSDAVEATITMTGEYGLLEAIEPLAAWIWPKWQEDYADLRGSDAPQRTAVEAKDWAKAKQIVERLSDAGDEQTMPG
jgi:hypothetical protein